MSANTTTANANVAIANTNQRNAISETLANTANVNASLMLILFISKCFVQFS